MVTSLAELSAMYSSPMPHVADRDTWLEKRQLPTAEKENPGQQSRQHVSITIILIMLILSFLNRYFLLLCPSYLFHCFDSNDRLSSFML